MLDNLRDQDSSPIFLDEVDSINDENLDLGLKPNYKHRKFNGKILGLKSQQLFFLLVMLLLVVILLGAMFLLVTGKIVPSIL